jgi:hypothetical protein
VTTSRHPLVQEAAQAIRAEEAKADSKLRWSHALTRSTRDGEVLYAVREIYFHDREHPEGWTDPIAPGAETVSGLLAEIRQFEDASQGARVFDVDLREWVPVPSIASDEA